MINYYKKKKKKIIFFSNIIFNYEKKYKKFK